MVNQCAVHATPSSDILNIFRSFLLSESPILPKICGFTTSEKKNFRFHWKFPFAAAIIINVNIVEFKLNTYSDGLIQFLLVE